MSEMIERVAIAIGKADGFEWDGMKRRVSGAIERDAYRKLARAAIEAMREPTQFMLDEGADGSGEGSWDVARGAWEAMIDAALAQPK